MLLREVGLAWGWFTAERGFSVGFALEWMVPRVRVREITGRVIIVAVVTAVAMLTVLVVSVPAVLAVPVVLSVPAVGLARNVFPVVTILARVLISHFPMMRVAISVPFIVPVVVLVTPRVFPVVPLVVHFSGIMAFAVEVVLFVWAFVHSVWDWSPVSIWSRMDASRGSVRVMRLSPHVRGLRTSIRIHHKTNF